MKFQQPSTLDDPQNYQLGNLSKFPAQLDTEQNLYIVSNRATAILSAAMTPTSTMAILDDVSLFPASGVVKIGSELVFYERVEKTILVNLIRGFSGTGPGNHNRGSKVELVILADHHNAIRDSLYQLETKVGLRGALGNRDGNLSERVTYLRNKWWKPRALWFARPQTGPAPLKVQFLNFSRGFPTAFMWTFGDGATSTEKDPVHVYTKVGLYNVTLRVFTDNGSNRAYKYGEIDVVDTTEVTQPLVWVDVWNRSQQKYVQGFKGKAPLRVRMIDQTLGDIMSRTWNMGDGTIIQQSNPFELEVEHVYAEPGQYQPSLFLQINSDKTLNFDIPFLIEVLD